MFKLPARMRVICDNDYAGDPDGLVQLVHHVLSPSCDIRGIIATHGHPGEPGIKATVGKAVEKVHEVLAVLGVGNIPVVAGAGSNLTEITRPIPSAGTELIIREALRDDTELPLYVACGGSLTEIASALLIEPRIAERLTVIWIGGVEHPEIGVPAAGPPVEYNLELDVVAARVVFNSATVPLWQVPRDAYRLTLMSNSELFRRVSPCGRIGALLTDAIIEFIQWFEPHGWNLGETYLYGDSPLVLLTALQSSFYPGTSTSGYRMLPAPGIRKDGTTDFETRGRLIRVYTTLDYRLMFEDFIAKLELHTTANP